MSVRGITETSVVEEQRQGSILPSVPWQSNMRKGRMICRRIETVLDFTRLAASGSLIKTSPTQSTTGNGHFHVCFVAKEAIRQY